jgi:membrane-bound metal-dependent hydrolase YbcI (DUF457 family)
MFIGHFGLALASKRLTPNLNLGVSMVAAQTLDIVWPVLVLTGIEKVAIDPHVSVANPLVFEHYPYSHSLLAAFLWAIAFGAIAKLLSRTWKEALVLAGLVLSHWVLDFLVHVPDLPLTLGPGPKFGLGLWQSMAASLVIEFGLLSVGVWAYWGGRHPTNRRGRLMILALLVLLIAIQLGSYFGPPPPHVNAIAVSALGMWLFFGMGYWADRQPG